MIAELEPNVELPEIAWVVELPVCPVCGNVSKYPIGASSFRAFCTGPAQGQHKRTKMKPVKYRALAAADE